MFNQQRIHVIMKPIAISILTFFQSILLHAQSAGSNLQAMVDAEHAFIQMAKEKNTRDAFLFFLTDDAITTGPASYFNPYLSIK